MTDETYLSRAFPKENGSPGMFLRDYFAGQALKAAWAARDAGYFEGDDLDMAKCAYQMADAMIKARAEQ